MAVVTPAFAIVRPRVVVKRTGETGLLDDIVAAIAEEYGTGFVRLTGGPGSGKSTALAHLAAVFTYHDHIQFLDEPTEEQLAACSSDHITIAAMPASDGRNMELALQPWGMDELIEYLLVAHHDDCGSIISRLGAAARRQWNPQVACAVLDQFAADYELHDPSDALVVRANALLGNPKQRLAALEYCVAVLTGGTDASVKAVDELAKSNCVSEARNLLRHMPVQLPLAAARIVSLLHKGYFADLEKHLPFELIELVGWQCEANPGALEQLRKSLALQRADAAHPMAASVMLVADPKWRPERPRKSWRLSGGLFRHARWNGVNFFRAHLDQCDFSDAKLDFARFENASLASANLSRASLRGADMTHASASSATFDAADLHDAKMSSATFNNANFTDADLTEANLAQSDLRSANLTQAVLRRADLTLAKLEGAVVTDADFSDANLRQADLAALDLRATSLNGACLEKAILAGAQMEDVQFLHARLFQADLRSAHLTGSSFPAGDLREVDLRGAGLAEIDWEEADLRGANLTGATFHMGSSRSGLVNSPYACEGSKTGFYTDDLEDLTFKRPEEVRKANLRGADLRGAKADGVDFYLVDLREAKLDPPLREQASATGAIFDDLME
jgi:uncharacterized protein YjbI with pentapeptide repeats